FLPLFFVALGVVLAAAIGWRIHAYTKGDVRSTINGPVADSAPSGMREGRTGNTIAPQDATSASSTTVAYATPVTGSVQTTSRAAASGMSIREQRFAEALAAAQKASAEQPQRIVVQRPAPAPAIAPPPKPAEKPGILARIGNAISNAFNGNTSANAAPQP